MSIKTPSKHPRAAVAPTKQKSAPSLVLTGNSEVDELMASIRKAGNELRDTPGEARKYLLASGIYTKSLKLKKRFS